MRIAVTDRVGHTIAVLTGSRIAVFVIALGAVAVMTASVALAAPDTPLWPGLLLLSAALLALADSDSHLGLVLLVGYGAWWLLAVPASWEASLWAVPAASAVLGLHLALAHEAAGPGGVPSPHTQLGSLVSGAFLVLAATVGLAAVAVLSGDRWQTPAVVAGLAVALLALLPWLGHADLEPPEEDE